MESLTGENCSNALQFLEYINSSNLEYICVSRNLYNISIKEEIKLKKGKFLFKETEGLRVN